MYVLDVSVCEITMDVSVGEITKSRRYLPSTHPSGHPVITVPSADPNHHARLVMGRQWFKVRQTFRRSKNYQCTKLRRNLCSANWQDQFFFEKPCVREDLIMWQRHVSSKYVTSSCLLIGWGSHRHIYWLVGSHHHHVFWLVGVTSSCLLIGWITSSSIQVEISQMTIGSDRQKKIA